MLHFPHFIVEVPSTTSTSKVTSTAAIAKPQTTLSVDGPIFRGIIALYHKLS